MLASTGLGVRCDKECVRHLLWRGPVRHRHLYKHNVPALSKQVLILPFYPICSPCPSPHAAHVLRKCITQRLPCTCSYVLYILIRIRLIMTPRHPADPPPFLVP